jgi:hypothetical protein
MKNPRIERLPWEGDATVLAALAALSRHQDVELDLPESYHHTIRAHLQPEATVGTNNDVFLTGGAELIARIAEVRGLGALDALAQAVAGTDAEVQVESPLPRVLIHLSEDMPTA